MGADAELDPAALPPGDVVHDRRDDGLAVPAALGAEHAAAECARGRSRDRRWRPRPAGSTGTTATHDSTNDAPTARMPISRPFLGIRLPKNRIRKNDTAGIGGDDPGVVEHGRDQPFIWSTSSRSTLCGCGR